MIYTTLSPRRSSCKEPGKGVEGEHIRLQAVVLIRKIVKLNLNSPVSELEKEDSGV